MNDTSLIQMHPQERMLLHNLVEGKYYLEIGSGYSTAWVANLCDKVDSVETREEWFREVKTYTDEHCSNVTLYHFPPEECAYDDNGYERLISLGCGVSGYGTVEEFKSYIQSIKKLILKMTMMSL